MWEDPYEHYPLDASMTTIRPMRSMRYAKRIPWRVGVVKLDDPYLFDCGLPDSNINNACTHPGFIAEVIEFQMSGAWRVDERPKGDNGFEAVAS